TAPVAVRMLLGKDELARSANGRLDVGQVGIHAAKTGHRHPRGCSGRGDALRAPGLVVGLLITHSIECVLGTETKSASRSSPLVFDGKMPCHRFDWSSCLTVAPFQLAASIHWKRFCTAGAANGLHNFRRETEAHI